MSNREHEQEDDAAVSRLANALRAEVPVRPEWRNGVLGAIDALSPPVRPGFVARVTSWRRRTWVMSPLTGIAAALVCVAIGVVGAMAVLRPAAPDAASPEVVAAPVHAAADAQPSPTAGQSSGGTSVRFVIVSANATNVSLVGDFNGWNPRAMPMARVGDGGAWVRDVVLEPGRHVYAFYVDGALQVDPSAPRAAEDDFGIPSSALVVRNASQ